MNMNSDPTDEPEIGSVFNYLLFGLSLPERALRSTAAMAGGVLHESASLLVPQAFQDSTTYRTFVKQMLDLLANDVGGVDRTDPAKDDTPGAAKHPDEPDVEHYVAKKTVSTFVDLAGMATLHASPMTILAIVSDIAYGSKTFLNELANELKREGIIAEDSTISSAADLLEAVSAASADTVDVFDMPPISVDGLRDAIEQTREGISRIDPASLMPLSEIDRLWNDMQTMAERENVNVFAISSAMTLYSLGKVKTVSHGALTTIRVTGNFLDSHLFEHYREGLQEISERGIYGMLAETSKPYLDAVWYNFSSERVTITEDVVSGKLAGKIWGGFRDWMGGTT